MKKEDIGEKGAFGAKEIREALYKKGRLYAKRIKTGIIYGPITSRRSGISLGISPVKGGFLCNFACIYCQYGAQIKERGVFAKPFEVKRELEKRLKEMKKKKEIIDSLTICGPTEPTMNPEIRKIMDIVLQLRKKYSPKARTDFFTNASKIVDFSGIDEVYLKLDAGFKRIEKPKGKTTKEEIIENIIKANSKPKVIQSIWFKGRDGNFTEKDISEYIKDIKRIAEKTKIDLIQFYTLLYIPPKEKNIFPCNDKEMINLGKTIGKKTGVKIKVYLRPTRTGKKFRF